MTTTTTVVRIVAGEERAFELEVLPDAGPPEGYQTWRKRNIQSRKQSPPVKSVVERAALREKRYEPTVGEWVNSHEFVEAFRQAIENGLLEV